MFGIIFTFQWGAWEIRMRTNSMRSVQFSQPWAKHCARCFIYRSQSVLVIALFPQRGNRDFRSRLGVAIPLAYTSALVQRNSQGPSDWLVPILFRVKKVNCSTTKPQWLRLVKMYSLLSQWPGYDEPDIPAIQGYWLSLKAFCLTFYM